MKLNSNCLFELPILELNAIFVWYCLNTVVCESNNINTGTENAMQKKFD